MITCERVARAAGMVTPGAPGLLRDRPLHDAAVPVVRVTALMACELMVDPAHLAMSRAGMRAVDEVRALRRSAR